MSNTPDDLDRILYRYASQRDLYYSDYAEGVSTKSEWTYIRDKIQAEAKQALSTMLGEILPQGKQEQHACRFNDGKQQCDCYHQSIIDARQRATDRGFTL